MQAKTIAAANAAFAAFTQSAAQHAVTVDHADYKAVRAALPRDARKPFDALSPVGRVAALMQDDKAAMDIFIADGNAWANGEARFFLSCVALFLKFGDESARDVARQAWPDSKHKSREYALKIFRMAARAVEAGKVDELRAVGGFAALQALQPKKVSTEPQANAPLVADGIGAPDISGSTPEQDARAEAAQGAVSRAADIAAVLQRMAAIADAMSAAHSNTELDADALTQWAADLNVCRASLEALTA